MQYTKKLFQSFHDCVFSATGVFTAESVFLSIQLNDFDTLTPKFEGVVNINPAINLDLITETVNNLEITDFDSQLLVLTNILDNIIVISHDLPTLTTEKIGYEVKLFETIGDVCLNATGSYNNLFTILHANGFDSLTTILKAGQIIDLSGVNVQRNIQRSLQINPACNNFEINDFDDQLSEIILNFVYKLKQFESKEMFEFEDNEPYRFDL